MAHVNQDVIDAAYDWTIDVHGEICGLVAGDMCYEPTGITLDGDTLEIWEIGCKAWEEKHKKIEKLKRRLVRLEKQRRELKAEHKGQEHNYTYYGGYSLGHIEGRIFALEGVIDIMLET